MCLCARSRSQLGDVMCRCRHEYGGDDARRVDAVPSMLLVDRGNGLEWLSRQAKYEAGPGQRGKWPGRLPNGSSGSHGAWPRFAVIRSDRPAPTLRGHRRRYGPLSLVALRIRPSWQQFDHHPAPAAATSAEFDARWNIKPRLGSPGVVANPRDAKEHRCGLRLARRPNSSVFLNFTPHRPLH